MLVEGRPGLAEHRAAQRAVVRQVPDQVDQFTAGERLALLAVAAGARVQVAETDLVEAAQVGLDGPTVLPQEAVEPSDSPGSTPPYFWYASNRAFSL